MTPVRLSAAAPTVIAIPARSQIIPHYKLWLHETGLKRRLTIAALLVPICAATAGVLLLFPSIEYDTIDPWRFILLLADAFSCVTVVCAIHARGRENRHVRKFGRGR
jgi:hypothetical protein